MMVGSGHPAPSKDFNASDQDTVATQKPTRKKPKKGKKKQNPDSAVLSLTDGDQRQPPSAPPASGNKNEAEQIRKRLGIKAEDPKSSQARVGFHFAFSVTEAGPDVQATDSDHASPTLVETDTAPASDLCTNIIEEADDPGKMAVPLLGPPANGAKTQAAQQPDESGYIPRRVYIGGMPFWYSEEDIRQCWSECGEISDLTMLTFPDTGNFRGILFVTFATQVAYDAALQYDGDELDGKRLVVKPCKAPVPNNRGSTRNSDQRKRDDDSKHGADSGAGHDRDAGQRSSAQKRGRADAHKGPNHVQEGESSDEPGTKKPRKSYDAPPKRVKGYNVLFVGNIPWELSRSAVAELFEDFKPKFVRMFDKAGTRQHKGFAHVHFASEESVDKALSMNGASIMGRKLKVMYAQPSRAQSSKSTAVVQGRDLIEDGA